MLANKYVAEVAPWTLAKRRKQGQGTPAGDEAEQRLATVLYNLVETLRLVALYLTPILPATSAGILKQLGPGADVPVSAATPALWSDATLAWGGFRAGSRVQPGTVLFPKLETPASERA